MLPHHARDVEISVKTKAEELDLQTIAALNILAWGGQVDETAVQKKAQKLKKRIVAVEPSRQSMVIATARGHTVGYCRVVQDGTDASCWWLEGLIVHPAFRCRAVGRTAVYWAIAYACARGAVLMRSETHTDNPASITFHEKLGFRNDGEFTAKDGDRKVGFSLPLVGFHPGDCANSYDADPHIAESFDQIETQTDDIALLRRLIGKTGPWNIFEPFCGSGRIFIPLAADGHTLVGLDLAQTMLDRARAKMAQLPAEVQRRITLICGDATAADWPGGFDLVLLGGNCFYELGCARQQEGCIASAARALKPGGYVYVDNDHMEGPLLDSWQRPGKGVTPFPGGLCGDGTRMQGTSETIWTDPAARIWLARRGTTAVRLNGTSETYEWIQWKHPVSTDEVAGWLAKHGFAVERLFGDRKGNPYTPQSPRAIFWARKKLNPP